MTSLPSVQSSPLAPFIDTQKTRLTGILSELGANPPTYLSAAANHLQANPAITKQNIQNFVNSQQGAFANFTTLESQARKEILDEANSILVAVEGVTKDNTFVTQTHKDVKKDVAKITRRAHGATVTALKAQVIQAADSSITLLETDSKKLDTIRLIANSIIVSAPPPKKMPGACDKFLPSKEVAINLAVGAVTMGVAVAGAFVAKHYGIL